jgi:hypothetical protein
MSTIWSLLLVTSLLVPGPGGGSPPPEEVQICALKLIASGTLGADQQPELDAALKQLRSIMPKSWSYSQYRSLGKECHKLKVGKSAIYKLPAPYRMIAERLEGKGKAVRVSSELFKGNESIGGMVHRLGQGGAAWVGGPKSSGGQLWVLVSASW